MLPYPATGRQYGYLDKDIPILGPFRGTQDVVLTLPPGVSTANLRYQGPPGPLPPRTDQDPLTLLTLFYITQIRMKYLLVAFF